MHQQRHGSKRDEFGCKVSASAAHHGGSFVGAMAFHANPYDGHTLTDILNQVKRIEKNHSMYLWIEVIADTTTKEILKLTLINPEEVKQPEASGAG